MIKLVVFDWNGTLLADITAVLEGSNRELAAMNRPTLTLSEFQSVFEVPLVKYYKRLGIYDEYKLHAPEINRTFHAFYEPRVAKTRTRSGTKSTLEELGKQKITRIILSNHTMEGIYLQLERLKLTHHFETILANENTYIVHTIGKKARLHNYLKEQTIQPQQVAIVGDTTEEIEIGRELGLKTIAITGGYHSIKRLKAAKPDVLIHKLRDIIKVLEEI